MAALTIYDASSRARKKRLVGAATGGRIQSEAGPSVVQALDGVALHFRHDDRIGHNGAGKTTLLRVLAGIYKPGGGTVQVDAQVAPLFYISLGINTESTGYEIIVLRGPFLGISRAEIEARIKEIAEFTELGRFLEFPIRTHSSGMHLRLAFAVSTSIQPDILLLDEGIGAGDAAFREKGERRMQEFSDQASIIVLASHADGLVQKMCRTSVLMQHGQVIGLGTTEEVLAQYRQHVANAQSWPRRHQLPLIGDRLRDQQC